MQPSVSTSSVWCATWYLSFSLHLSLRCPLALFGAGSISLFVHNFSTSWSLFSFLAWVLGWCCVLYRKKVQVTIHLTSISIHPIHPILFFSVCTNKTKNQHLQSPFCMLHAAKLNSVLRSVPVIVVQLCLACDANLAAAALLLPVRICSQQS